MINYLSTCPTVGLSDCEQSQLGAFALGATETVDHANPVVVILASGGGRHAYRQESLINWLLMQPLGRSQ